MLLYYRAEKAEEEVAELVKKFSSWMWTCVNPPCYCRAAKAEEEVAELVKKSQHFEVDLCKFLHVTIGLKRLKRRWLSW
jgi:hypothetical protein